jgi:hypothetical protein
MCFHLQAAGGPIWWIGAKCMLHLPPLPKTGGRRRRWFY